MLDFYLQGLKKIQVGLWCLQRIHYWITPQILKAADNGIHRRELPEDLCTQPEGTCSHVLKSDKPLQCRSIDQFRRWQTGGGKVLPVQESIKNYIPSTGGPKWYSPLYPLSVAYIDPAWGHLQTSKDKILFQPLKSLEAYLSA